jgi:hypothetical protein
MCAERGLVTLTYTVQGTPRFYECRVREYYICMFQREYCVCMFQRERDTIMYVFFRESIVYVCFRERLRNLLCMYVYIYIYIYIYRQSNDRH